MFADGVGVVLHRVVEALGGDGAEVGPRADGVLYPGRPRVEPRLHVNVQLGITVSFCSHWLWFVIISCTSYNKPRNYQKAAIIVIGESKDWK